MASSGGQPGNQNAARSRLFHDALVRVIKSAGELKRKDGKTLRKAAEALLDAACAGDIAAIRELRDTLDGKPHQSISGPEDGPLVVRLIDCKHGS